MWNGDYLFLLNNLVKKDFKARYRNMSLGVFWSVLNPLVTMAVLVFVFSKIFTSPRPYFPVFILCGLTPFNFFTLAWSTGTGSLLDNASIMKRVPVPREIIPIATVLGNCLHLAIQIGLLLTFTLALGLRVNPCWMWMPYIWAMYIVFVCGLTLISSALNVFVRDTRYFVEAFNVVLFWIVPVIYDFSDIPARYKEIYHLNPVSAMILALRYILIQGSSPPLSLLFNLFWCSFLVLGVGLLFFRKVKDGFYDYL